MGAGCGSPAGLNNGGGADNLDAGALRPNKPLQATMPPYRVKKRMTHEQLIQERQVCEASSCV